MAKSRDIEVVIAAKEMVSGMLGKAIAAIGGFAAVAATIYKSVEAASEAELAQTKLATALGHVSAALNDQAAAMQKTTMYEDDTVTAAQAMVAAFTKNEDSIRRITAAAADLASAKGMDLVSATELVTKSVYGETNALGRYGIAADGAAGSTQRLEGLMKNLNAHFGGQAAAQARTFSGAMAYMKNQFDDLLESIGEIIVKNPAVIAAIRMIGEACGKMAAYIMDNKDALKITVQDGLVFFLDSMGVVVTIMKDFAIVTDKGSIALLYMKWVTSGFREDYRLAIEVKKKEAEDTIVFWNRVTDSIIAASDAVASANVTGSSAGAAGIGAAGEDPAAKAAALQLQTDAILVQANSLLYLAENYGIMDMAANAALSNVAGQEEVLARASQFRSNVSTAANRAMESQILKLVETHRFSVGEFGKAVMQAVKIELVGIAARAAVWALFEVAMGLATMFTNPAASSAHFASAGQFAAVAGATVAAAMAVNALSGPGAQQPGAGEPGGTPIQVQQTGGMALLSAGGGGITYETHITIMNPLNGADVQQVVEQYVMPAITDAQSRNVQ
jgi:hypothetical protein